MATDRIADLEADLEELRPIAEQHPIAAVKHIGLREIPQAVGEVFADVKTQRDELRAALQLWVDYLDTLDAGSIPGDPLTEARRKHHAKRMEVSRRALARSAPHNAKATT